MYFVALAIAELCVSLDKNGLIVKKANLVLGKRLVEWWEICPLKWENRHVGAPLTIAGLNKKYFCKRSPKLNFRAEYQLRSSAMLGDFHRKCGNWAVLSVVWWKQEMARTLESSAAFLRSAIPCASWCTEELWNVASEEISRVTVVINNEYDYSQVRSQIQLVIITVVKYTSSCLLYE